MIGIILFQNKRCKDITTKLSTTEELFASERYFSFSTKTSREFEIFFNGEELPLSTQVIGKRDSVKYLNDIIKDATVVLRYSEFHCNTCIDTMINNLIELSNKIGDKHILLLVSSTSTTYINLFSKSKKLSFKIYRLSPDLEKRLPDINIPYYFVIEKSNMRINSAFVPLKENNKLTKKYMEKIKEHYFK